MTARARVIPPRLLRWGLNAAYGGLSLVLVPYALARAATDPKTRARWRAWLRDVPARFRRRAPRRGKRPSVWLHGVSVGEVKAAAELVERIERAVPGVEVVVSVSTATGRRVALERYPGLRIEFYPPDLSWIVGDALDALRPGLVILVESGFWPNLLSGAAERGIPVAIVNGRISERSSRRFKVARTLSRWMLRSVDTLCVQLPVHEERFRSLGVDPARIRVTGNMKLDNVPVRREDPRRAFFARLLPPGGEGPVLVAGSTHPGEERALAEIHARQRAKGRPLRLVVAPRHPERADAAEAEIRGAGFPVVRRSRLDDQRRLAPGEVLLVDTVGELESLYSVADLVFVGGTLVPHGGQNMMEPASLGRPVVIGPWFHNFRGEVDLLQQADGIVVVPDAEGVERTIESWIAQPATAGETGRRAREAILASKGATERTLRVLEPLLARLAPLSAAR